MTLEYYFEMVQQLKFVVWDIDNVKLPIEKQDFIGHLETTVAELVSGGGTMSRSLVNPRYPKGCGQIHILVQEVRDSSMNAEFKFGCSNLDKKDLFGKSDGFLRISKPTDASFNNYQAVHQTEVIKNNLNPVWQPFSIPMQRLCNGNVSLPLLWQVYDWNASGKEDFIGEFKASFSEVAAAASFDLINPKKQGKRGYKNSGTFMVLKALATKVWIRLICCCDLNASVLVVFVCGVHPGRNSNQFDGCDRLYGFKRKSKGLKGRKIFCCCFE